MYYWRGNGKAKREWTAAHYHAPATVIGLQHESLWLAHRTTTVKCSKSHVRDATASEQMLLGPMLDALRAPQVPPGRDMQNSEDLSMDLDAPPLIHSRDTPCSTQPSEFTNSNEFAQRAQTDSVSLSRTPEPVVPCFRNNFSTSATWKRCARDTIIASQRRSHASDATIPEFSRRRDGARDATCGKCEICRVRAFISLSPCARSHVQRVKHTCSIIHVAHGSC